MNQRLDTKCSFVSRLRLLKSVFGAASLRFEGFIIRKHEPGFLHYLFTPSLMVLGTNKTRSRGTLSSDKLPMGLV